MEKEIDMANSAAKIKCNDVEHTDIFDMAFQPLHIVEPKQPNPSSDITILASNKLSEAVC